jgi:hypothetical protein
MSLTRAGGLKPCRSISQVALHVEPTDFAPQQI